jgi:hypothetical protein
MATTSNTYTGNGSNKLFSITFPYLDTSDIDVYLNGTLQTIITEYTFANATTVEFVAAPANGAVVLLDRSTDDATLQATFFPGSSIKANDLNFNFDQVLYLSQETANIAQNQSTAGLQTQITAANNTSNTALTTANAANATANGIAGTANTALTNANVAVVTANAATSTANAAVVTANSATSTANAATVIANSALSTVSGLSGVNLNRIINGDMRIDQRNAGAAVTVDNGAPYTLDRWLVEDGSDAVLSAQQTTDVPAGQGFTNSLRVTATTADASIGASQFDVITQIIEGFNCSDLGWGGAGANSVTASFWVKASVAGQYSCTVYNYNQSRINPQPFTINSANTWEKKTVTFAGDTTGTWLTTNGRGIAFNVYLALGSSLLGSAGWNGSSIFGVTGQANAVATVSNTFYITGVQLESGAAATPFERRSYGTELALCQRYFQVGVAAGGGGTLYPPIATSTTQRRLWVQFPVIMRTAPTMTNVAISNIGSPSAAAYSGGVQYFGAAYSDIECAVQDGNASAEL